MLTIAEAAKRVGRSPGTVSRWIREGRLPADTARGERLIDSGDLDMVRDLIYPILPVSLEWQRLEDGTPPPNWVAGVALSRLGRRNPGAHPGEQPSWLIVKDQPTTAETTDPEGRRVVLPDAIWREKIVRDHPEIDPHMSDVLQACDQARSCCCRPDLRRADPLLRAGRRSEPMAAGRRKL
jgi:excisionase family DNA binding protein